MTKLLKFRQIILNPSFFILLSLLSFCNKNSDKEQTDSAENKDILESQDADTQKDASQFEAIHCPEVQGTKKSLREKAEYFDKVAQEWHIPKGQDLYFSVFLKDDLKTFDHVDMSDNVGSWTSMYAASQSFRYAATRSPEALDNLKRIIKGEQIMLKITGIKGLFTRVFINPALPGFPSADQLKVWYPDCDLSIKHCKKFVEVTEGEFKGYWFKTDVSKDEYTAHMFSMASAWELVDDPDVKNMVSEIVLAVADHLIENKLEITDIDGKVTTYGKMYAMAFDDFPGFNAILTLSWIKLAEIIGGKKYADFYDDCLLQKSGENTCIPQEMPAPYTSYLNTVGLNLDCKTNWNNHNMAQLAMYSLIRFEGDPALKSVYRTALRDQLWHADDPRPMSGQKNTLFTFFYLVNRDPSDAWPENEAREAICTMKIFPEFKGHHATDNFAKYPEVCLDRSDEPMTDVVIPIDETGMDNDLWIRNPYSLEKEPENLQIVESPEDFLLAYWMGRYFGFIPEEM